jgi:tripartite-type tricarboxylate transporter receptor subunit TctC
MTSMTRRGLLATAVALPCTSLPSVRAVRAQVYLSRTIHLLVGGAAGSVPDTVARLIGERLGAALGQNVVVENRPGAGGNIAMQALVSSAALEQMAELTAPRPGRVVRGPRRAVARTRDRAELSSALSW